MNLIRYVGSGLGSIGIVFSWLVSALFSIGTAFFLVATFVSLVGEDVAWLVSLAFGAVIALVVLSYAVAGLWSLLMRYAPDATATAIVWGIIGLAIAAFLNQPVVFLLFVIAVGIWNIDEKKDE